MPACCRPPIALSRALEDPRLVRRLVEANGPYWPVQRYFAGESEYRAASGKEASDRPMVVAPVFRGDWAYDRPVVEGVEPILDHPGFGDAARAMFDGACVRPFSVYCNLTWQLPFNQGGGHIDVPEFRGINRTDYPIWLLSAMGHSRLFEEERIDITTAVAWFYQGADGGFTYWPDGPDAPPKIHEGDIFNTAIVGDNDRMFHRVRPTGRTQDGMLTRMTLDSQLAFQGGGDWAIETADETLAKLRYEELRISISWKARVFHDEDAERRYLLHDADLSVDDVVARFESDLERRGIRIERPGDPIRDPAWIDLLAEVYVREPTIPD